MCSNCSGDYEDPDITAVADDGEHGQPFDLDAFQEMLRKYYESEQQETHAREFLRQFWGGPSFVNGGR